MKLLHYRGFCQQGVDQMTTAATSTIITAIANIAAQQARS
jgi:hypothetical protein